jgi:Tol biopolymer transport system component
VQQYAWSPDGNTLAVACNSGVTWLRNGIYLSNANGSAERLFVAGARAPSWSPDGTRLAFEGDDGFIWTMMTSGVTAARLTDAPFPESSPQWSPDGRRVAYIASRSPGEPLTIGLAVVDSRAVAASFLSLPVLPAEVHRSPDGKYLAFSSLFVTPDQAPTDAGIWLVRADGSDLRPLSANRAPSGSCSSPSHLGPVWAPDGTRLAWSTVRSGEQLSEAWMVVGRRSGEEEARARVGGMLYTAVAYPQWSPDGSLLAYQACSATDSSVVELRVSAPDGGGVVTKLSPFVGAQVL